MKKLVFAFVLASASLSLVIAPMLRAQDTITIKDPAEYNTYQNAFTQKDPTAKAAALESFLTAYPQSVVKSAVLDNLIDTYQGLGNADKTLSAATRLLQVDPNNMKAIFWSVLIKKSQCGKTVNPKTGVTSDPQTCDDAAALAQRGLTAPKPAATSPDDWKKLTAGTYPAFHSAIALDDVVSKKDTKAGISEYRTELMLYTPEQTQSGPGLQDTLQLAGAYTKPDAKDLVQAVWFYSRAWNFVSAPIKPAVEKAIEYYYTQYHGNLDGLDAVKTQAGATLFPPGTFVISAAPTPAELAHKAIVETPDLSKMALVDTEFILANGTKDDTDKLWAVLKDQVTPVPGVVISATDSVIKIAVTKDAQTANVADFIVNLKKPLTEKEIPAAGFTYKIPPATALVGTYDSFTQVPGTDTVPASVQIVLREGEIQLEKRKPAPAHKPAAGHHPSN
ncbi:MAG: hypothetical protein WAK26_19440 [Terracidiphilus sp.]